MMCLLRKHVHAIYSDIHGSKNENFLIKKDNILIFAQNIDCVYTLEPPP